ncbi:uncharacterized protein LOC119436936 isoform X1 [Dermacentor silvarum]|uniref:uncharacterized protein LOC119436936 isoform X1 n=1 Tax=Dermacentor silvarum TaxID=543639 RepID=UPI0021019C39|nr:uncharacterized protein LOC119436936 isoform X1 [Dermacentor silvarum]
MHNLITVRAFRCKGKLCHEKDSQLVALIEIEKRDDVALRERSPLHVPSRRGKFPYTAALDDSAASTAHRWLCSVADGPSVSGGRLGYMSYGSPCRCTCGALGNARSQSRPNPRLQRYSRVKISRQGRVSGEPPARVTASSAFGSRSLAEGVAGNDVDAFIELLSSPPSRDSVADGGSDGQQQHQLTQATSIGCSPSSSNAISRSSGTPVLTPRSTSNELTISEQHVVQLFMDEVDVKEREIAAALAAAAAKEQEEENSHVEATAAEDDSPWPTYRSAEAGHRRARKMGCGALAAPSTLAFVLLAAVLVSNAMLAVAYYEERTWLCVITVGLMHAPSLLFFVTRVYSVVVLASIKEHFMRALVLVWYWVTLPLLHFLPLLTLSSVLFDKVMMMMGDPSDMRLFIGRQEDVAFSDLIWVAVLHAFPQAVLQLHLLLFAGGAALLRGDWPDYTAPSRVSFAPPPPSHNCHSADGIRAVLRATGRLCGHLLQQVRVARPRRRRRDHGWVRHLRDHHHHHHHHHGAAGLRRGRHRHRLPAQVRRLAAHYGGAHRGRQLAAGCLLRAGRAGLGAGARARGPPLVAGVPYALQRSQVLWRPGAGPHHACVCARLPRPKPRRAGQHHVRCGLPVRHVPREHCVLGARVRDGWWRAAALHRATGARRHPLRGHDVRRVLAIVPHTHAPPQGRVCFLTRRAQHRRGRRGTRWCVQGRGKTTPNCCLYYCFSFKYRTRIFVPLFISIRFVAISHKRSPGQHITV